MLASTVSNDAPALLHAAAARHNDDVELDLLDLLAFSSLEEIVPAGQVNKHSESQNTTLINIEA